MFKSNLVKLFESRKGRLDYRVKRDYVRNGIATIPCRISDYSDVISPYSVKGCETLNKEFEDYLKEAADLTPPECPLVLNIIGDCLSQEEKETIEDTILDDFSCDLGVVERENKRHTHVFSFMLIGMLLSLLLLWFTETLAEEPRELLYVLFWFMAETLCDYIFLTGHDLRWSRRQAGRLASIKVVFSESYRDPHYTQSDVEQLYSEIEKDVKETILEEE